jgi:hypothetical protein
MPTAEIVPYTISTSADVGNGGKVAAFILSL